MNTINNIAFILLCSALGWMACIAFPGAFGVCIGVVLLLAALLHVCLNKRIMGMGNRLGKLYHIPVLAFCTLLLLGVTLSCLEWKSPLFPTFILLGLVGILGIIGWIRDGGYKKDLYTLWQDDLYILSYEAEVAVIIMMLIDGTKDNFLSARTGIVIAVAVLDILNQLIMKVSKRRRNRLETD